MPYLDQWTVLEEGYSSSLSGVTKALQDALLRLPIVGNVKADIRELEAAFDSATAMLGSLFPCVQRFMPKAERIDDICSDLAKVVNGEKAIALFWKVEQLAEEADSLKESVERYSMRQQRRLLEAKERAELMERANGDSAHVLRIFDEEAQAMQSARNSRMMLEEAYATGVAVLSKYAEQRDRLKRAQRKTLDILNTVGLSNSVLKFIERRHRVDKWIAYAGQNLHS